MEFWKDVYLKPSEIQGTIYNNVGEGTEMDNIPPCYSNHDRNERKDKSNITAAIIFFQCLSHPIAAVLAVTNTEDRRVAPLGTKLQPPGGGGPSHRKML